MSIKVALFNGQPGVKMVEFERLALENGEGYRCSPEDSLTLEQAREIAAELGRGRTEGYVGRMRWYRQAGGSIET